MSTSDGEKATANTFNTSYVSREVDDNKVAKLDLQDADTDDQIDVQSNLNTLQSYTGATRNGSPTEKPAFTTDNIGGSGDNLFQRTDAIQAVTESNTNQININTQELTDVRTNMGTGSGATDNGSYSPASDGFNITADETTKQNIQDLVTEFGNRVPESQRNVANGFAGLDANARILPAQLPTSATEYKGAFDASVGGSGSPSLTDGVGTNGDLYRVSADGTVDHGSGNVDYVVGDAVIYNGSVWQKIPGNDIVTSVNSLIGDVSLTTDEIPEGTNEYYTEAKVDAVIAGASIDELADVDTTTVAPAEGQALVWNSTDSEWQPGDAGSGSGAGSKTYFDDGDFENSIDIASVYDDGGSYVDGDGGSPVGLSILSTSTALAGENSLEITKAAVDAAGEGVTLLSETIDEIDLGKELIFQLSVDFSDANYTSDDVQLRAYDVTNSAILPVVPISNLSDDAGIFNNKTTIFGKVLPATDTAQVRLSLHQETDSNTGSSWVARVDEARIGPGSLGVGAAANTIEEKFLTTNITSDVTMSDLTFSNLEVGAVYEVRAQFHLVVNDGSTDSLVFVDHFHDGSRVGRTLFRDQDATASRDEAIFSTVYTFTATTTSLTFLAQNATADSFIQGSGSGTNRAESYVQLEKRNDISSNNLLSSTDTAFSTSKTKLAKTTNQTITTNTDTPITFDNVIFDTTGAEDTANDRIIIPKTGYYILNAATRLSGTDTGSFTLKIQVNGDNVAVKGDSGAGATGPNVIATRFLNKGDFVTLVIDSDTDTNYTVNSDSSNTYLEAIEQADFSVFGTYGTFEVISANSSLFRLDTSGFVSGEYPAFTGNDVSLSPGTWELNGLIQLSDDGANPVFEQADAIWSLENGDNTNTQPSPIIPDHSEKNSLGSRVRFNAGGENLHSFKVHQEIITLSEPTTIYLNVRTFFTTAGDGEVGVGIIAKRLR